jgi:outer membrane receptor protein involved in Fe transport
LFGNTGVTKPNPALDPEKSFNRDVGFVVAYDRLRYVERLRFEYAYFDNEVDDLIGFRLVRPNQFEAQNFDDVHLSGHELSIEARIFDHLRVAANYTRQDSNNRSQAPSERGRELPLLPRDEVYTRFEVFTAYATPYYEYTFTGRNFLVPSNLEKVDSRTIHNLGVTVTPIEALQINFEVANLTDNDLRDLTAFPLPGRSFFGSARYQF